MKALKGLVLSGGQGSRLRPLTYSMAKQLVPVANRPILHYPMDNLVKAGITDIGVIISPETGSAIQESLNKWCPAGVTLTYILQDKPAGLAHAVKTAQPFMGDSPFVMYLGDNLIEDGIEPLVEAFRVDKPDAHILLKQVENPTAFGVAVRDNATGRVTQLVEKPKTPPSNLALVGVYLFQSIIFEAIDNIKPSPRGELEITDAIQYLITHGKNVQATEMQGWWLDTGKKDDLLAANQIVLDSYCQLRLDGEVLDCQVSGEVEIEPGVVVRNSDLKGPLRIASGCVIENAQIGPHTCVGANSILKNITVENSVILERCQLEGLKGRLIDSLIGQGCKIQLAPDNCSPDYRLMLGEDNSWLASTVS